MAVTPNKPTAWWPGIRDGHPLARGLVGLWPAWWEGTSRIGNIAPATRHKFHMTPYNTPTWTPEGWLFDDGSSEYHEHNAAVVSSVPISMGCRFKPDVVNAELVLMCIADQSAANHWHAMYLRGVSSDHIVAYSQSAAAAGLAETTTTFVADVWQHGCAVFAASNDRRCYLNGGSKGTNATAVSPTGLDRTAIGRLCDSTPSWYMSGLIDMPMIWNRALSDSDAEMAAEPSERYSLITPRTKTYLFLQAAGGHPARRRFGGIPGAASPTPQGVQVW